MSIGSKIVLGCGVAAICALTFSAAQAASEGFCREYAQVAVGQAFESGSIQRCRRGMDGPRWSKEYEVHFKWCRSHGEGAAEDERVARREHLRSCNHH
jgi:hypothetical protein